MARLSGAWEPSGPGGPGVVAWLVVPGEPVAKERPRLGYGRVRTPAATKAAEEAIGWELLAQRVQPNGVDRLVVKLDFHVGPRRGLVDIDNLVKLVLDACNGFAWRDDSQVVRLASELHRDAETPRTVIRIFLADVLGERDPQTSPTSASSAASSGGSDGGSRSPNTSPAVAL